MKLLKWIFGCPHQRYSWPRTVHEKQGSRTYVACLDCGCELPYRIGAGLLTRIPQQRATIGIDNGRETA